MFKNRSRRRKKHACADCKHVKMNVGNWSRYSVCKHPKRYGRIVGDTKNTRKSAWWNTCRYFEEKEVQHLEKGQDNSLIGSNLGADGDNTLDMHNDSSICHDNNNT